MSNPRHTEFSRRVFDLLREIYALALSGQVPDLDRLNALIASWEGEIERKYSVSLDLKVTQISEHDARSVSL